MKRSNVITPFNLILKYQQFCEQLMHMGVKFIGNFHLKTYKHIYGDSLTKQDLRVEGRELSCRAETRQQLQHYLTR